MLLVVSSINIKISIQSGDRWNIQSFRNCNQYLSVKDFGAIGSHEFSVNLALLLKADDA
jgi:hypothetical protein